MKFAKVFQQVLNEEEVPQEWVETAIPYKQLKKQISRIVACIEEGEVEPDRVCEWGQLQLSTTTNTTPVDEFCGQLEDAVARVRALRDARRKVLRAQVEVLVRELGQATRPAGKSGRSKRSDISVWREVFYRYIDAEVFFATRGTVRGQLTAGVARDRYDVWAKGIEESGLVQEFSNRRSVEALRDFQRVNAEMLAFDSYETLNGTAVRKILKKFGKHTSLSVGDTTSVVFVPSTALAQDICCLLQDRVLPLVPQLSEHLCPVCCAVAFKPVRLGCGHRFCVRCLVKLRRAREDRCPLCRADCLLSLTVADLDVAHMNYLKMYFPKEVRAKIADDNKEIIKEMSGGEKSCVVM